MRNSLILNFILLIPDKTHIGVIKAVSKTKNIEIPSMPNLKSTKPLIHFFSSTN